MKQLFLIVFMCGSLMACNQGQQPSVSTEVAVKGLYSASFSPAGDLAVVGSIYHGGSLWRAKDHERLYNWNHRKEEMSNIIASAISPEGGFALTADHRTMVLWNAQTGESLTFWTAPGDVLSAALGPNGNYALLGLSDHSAVIFDTKRGGVKRTFYHKNRVRSVALSRDGAWAVTGSEDRTAKIWSVSNGKEVATVTHDEDVQLVAISADGGLALSVSKYDKALVWKARTGDVLAELPMKSFAVQRGLTFSSAAFSADGRQLMTGTVDRLVQLWGISKGKAAELKRWQLPKKDPWKPTSASVLAVSFGESKSSYRALASNGLIHTLKP